MTINQVIKAVDGMKPHSFSPDVLTMWINEIEGMAQTDVMLIGIEELTVYTYDTNADTVLLIHPPHDKVYIYYLCAMIDFANNDYDKYENTMILFNKFWGDYVRWYAMTYDPANGKAVERGYYLSAYLIAVSHGYKGTEDEWLKSLKGEKGDQGKGWVVNVHARDIDDLNNYSSAHTVYSGMVAAVGAKAPYQYYIYDDITGWVNHGYLSSEESKKAAEKSAEDAKKSEKNAELQRDIAEEYAGIAEEYAVEANVYAEVAKKYSEETKGYSALVPNIKGDVRGMDAIRLDCVPEQEAELKVNTNVVKSYGKNLTDYITPISKGTSHSLGVINVPMTVTVEFDESIPFGSVQLAYDDGGQSRVTFASSGKVSRTSITIDGTNLKFGSYRVTTSNTTEAGAVVKIQLELGDKSTYYEAYKPPVSGAVAISPTTTIIADTYGTELTAKYNKDLTLVITEIEKKIEQIETAIANS